MLKSFSDNFPTDRKNVVFYEVNLSKKVRGWHGAGRGGGGIFIPLPFAHILIGLLHIDPMQAIELLIGHAMYAMVKHTI
jgi:hypothetical protein